VRPLLPWSATIRCYRHINTFISTCYELFILFL
jgi:hypothetical protein